MILQIPTQAVLMEVIMQASAAWVSLLTPIGTVISLVVGIVGCTIAVKSYKKSRRIEFYQRRDQVSLAISDLNAKTSEAHLIAARLGIVILNRQPLARDERFGERQRAQIASMGNFQKYIELEATYWVETIKELHSICSRFTFGKTDPTSMENLKTMIQVASDDTKRVHV